MIRSMFKLRSRAAVVPWWQSKPTFQFAGRTYPLFVSGHNCGWPPGRMTERAVELSLVDHWLASVKDVDEVVEVGAVTPYYWPHRIRHVVDPTDSHPLVTSKASIFDVDLTGRAVLSISTFEHIGVGDYGMAPEPRLAGEAFNKLFQESPRFLVTVPTGYNAFVDDILFDARFSADGVAIRFLSRSANANDWRECPREQARLPYPRGVENGFRWSNGLVVISRDHQW